MNRHDITLTIWLVLFFCIMPFVVLNTKKPQRQDLAVVKVDGEIVKSIDIKEDSVIKIETPYGYNVITVEGGTICVSESDCNGKDCVLFGKTSVANRHIICLPHHLDVYLLNDGLNTDAVSH